MTTYKHQPEDARHRITGLVNADHVLTVGRTADKRERDWGEDSDLRPRVRRQPDWYFDAREPGSDPLKRSGHADDVTGLPRDGWYVGRVREGWDWTCDSLPIKPEHRARAKDATKRTGIPAGVPEVEWSAAPWVCAVCRVYLEPDPDKDGKTKYCGAECKAAGKAAAERKRYRVKNGIRKWPKDDRGWYIQPRFEDREPGAGVWKFSRWRFETEGRPPSYGDPVGEVGAVNSALKIGHDTRVPGVWAITTAARESLFDRCWFIQPLSNRDPVKPDSLAFAP
jgi:hypothetical protein